jgi:CHAT domain
MKTVVITVEPESAEQDGFPVHLSLMENVNGAWNEQRLASAVIPTDLSVDNPPLDPIENAPLKAENLREFLLQETESSKRFQPMGQYLFRLLGDAGEKWKDLRNTDKAGDKEKMRTILNIKPETLRRLPWELMITDNMPLFADRSYPFVRGGIDFNRKEAAQKWPLRALVVVGAREDDSAVKAKDEVAGIERGFVCLTRRVGRVIDWEVLWNPTRAEISDALTTYQPHIFHFIGHGGESANNPVLELWDREERTNKDWTLMDISAALTNHTPRFAFINSCRSNDPQTRANDQEKNWAIADGFVNAGVPAVLGMQGDIRGDAAAIFATKLYEALAEQKPLDVAIAEARQGVSNNLGFDRRDWALASLLLSVLPEHLLPVEFDVDPERLDLIRSDKDLRKFFDFVDRRPERRSVWKELNPVVQAQAQKNLLVILGDEDVGKSALVHCFLELCAVHDRQLIYVDLKDQSKNFIDIFRMIRDGNPQGSVISHPLKNRAAFNRFTYDLNHLLNGKLPPEPQGGLPNDIQDEGLSLDLVTEKGNENFIEAIFSSFRAALKQAAIAEPLILVLDQMDGLFGGDVKKLLRPYLIDEIAQRRIPNVRMILGLRPGKYQEFAMDALRGLFETVRVPLFKQEQFVPLAREFCLYHDKDDQVVF